MTSETLASRLIPGLLSCQGLSSWSVGIHVALELRLKAQVVQVAFQGNTRHPISAMSSETENG